MDVRTSVIDTRTCYLWCSCMSKGAYIIDTCNCIVICIPVQTSFIGTYIRVFVRTFVRASVIETVDLIFLTTFSIILPLPLS